jgi:hypothetical protein
MTDLAFSHFFFSCKHYQELAQERITKVVAFVTTNPTKLGLHLSEFSTNFYEFSKFQLIPNTIWDQTCTQVPGNKLRSQNYPYFAAWPLGRMWALQLGPRGTGRRRSGQIPANRRPCPAGRRQRTTCGSPWPDSQALLEQRATGEGAHLRPEAVAAASRAEVRQGLDWAGEGAR